MTPRGQSTFLRIFGAPLLLAVVTSFGLLSALLGDDVWDFVSWTALAAPLAVIARALARADRVLE
ncbi:MAG: hypothetical protein ACREQJ_11205 [Candidatus Binatia bacterium]